MGGRGRGEALDTTSFSWVRGTRTQPTEQGEEGGIGSEGAGAGAQAGCTAAAVGRSASSCREPEAAGAPRVQLLPPQLARGGGGSLSPQRGGAGEKRGVTPALPLPGGSTSEGKW